MAKKTKIGGQALLEGIMMRGPEKTAMAVRHTSGEMKMDVSPTKGNERAAFFKKPFIRGLFNMYDSLSVGYKCLMQSAEMSGMDEAENADKKEPSKWDKLFDKLLMPIATVLAVVLGVGLFMYLPTMIFKWVFPAHQDAWLLKSAFTGVIRIIIFVAYVYLTSLMKDIRRTYMYHGAEHKTIFCYEAGLPLTVENVRQQKRFHPRCGTSFLILVLLVSILVGMFIHIENAILYTTVKILLLPVVVSIGYELIQFAGRHDNLLTRILSAPGMWLQHLTTREPEDGMIECAIAAMEQVIPENGGDEW
ncbi:MAG: DUF1385 domain-containing protein [Clostridia bacterium]|nr:DUF1385 domain-containing protein [Clostridia bacterium]